MLEEFRLSWRQQSQAIEAANRILVLRQELIEMAASIERARHEIAALQPADANNNKIITATSELDAIVISTERASFEILNAAEKLMELSSCLREGGADPALCASMDNEVTAIFTACSFQDLTGQRTSKVVNALRYIEQRVNAMIAIWGASEENAPLVDDKFIDKREDAHLLHGPQIEGKGVSQSDVDALFFSEGPSAAVPKADLPDDEPENDAPRFNQADIDALMSGAAPAPPPKKPLAKPQSQMDIDALFGEDDPAPPPKPQPAPKAKTVPAPAPAPKTKESQSDIDAMFDAPAPKAKTAPPPPPAKPKAAPLPPAGSPTPLDQSAIDALFG